MDSRIGLDYIVENRDYIAKLGTALYTQNATVKKQVFELLSALCAYSPDGYARAIETLDFYKNLKKERYRFKIVINELEQSSAATVPPLDYQATLLAFINCVIISEPKLQERIRIRNEFIGLKVLPLLNNLRKVAQSVGDIIVQLDVFVEQQECDEAQSPGWAPDGINLNSHLDVFYAILRQVADKPQEGPFLSILQHLLRVDSREPLSDVIWDTCERLVHRATLIESPDDAVRLLRQQSAQKFTCSACRASDATSPTRKPAQPAQNAAKPPPPPPPMAPAAPAPPPPPPPIMNGGLTVNGHGPVLPPPPPPPSMSRPRTPMQPVAAAPVPTVVLLPQQDTPAPKAKMRTINWGMISQSKVLMNNDNIWSNMATQHRDSSQKDIDFIELEDLFQLQSTSGQGSPKLGRDTSGNQSSSGYDTLDRKSKKEAEITLLDGKRSLNVNIFVKQFRSGHQNIIQLIKDGVHEEIGAERLRGLLKILPVMDELDLLKSFNGDKTRLATAEKFLLQLLEVPNYKLRIESMLLKEEFAANVAYLEPCINAMLYAGDDLLNSKALQELLYLLVVAGNFLNSGGYAGNAAGVKLSSLQKLTDIRANKPGMNLIHFVALQAERRNPELLQFTAQLNTLENASKTTMEQINSEISTLENRITKISNQIEQPETDADIKQQMLDFLLAAKSELSVLKEGMKQVDALRLKLAEFFCEDAGTFKLEECFKIFQNFCDKFRQSIKENEKRVQQEQQATLRRKQREEQMAKRARQLGQAGTPVSDSDSFLGDGLFDPRASPALSRRQLGSGEITNGFIRLEQDSSASPDITPNGSLRRRPSRVLAGEDELMEFLRRSTGPYDGHASRDRKVAYGSLDRSIGRRARSGSSSRKRPELLNIDFGVDRERACSPAPLLQPQPQQQQDRLQSPLASSGTGTPTTTANTPVSNGPTTTIHIQSQHPQQQQQQPPTTTAHEDAKPRISREWRQKIETWLQSNENDEKQNEEYKRKRRLVNANRRSLENESENERKLDPLPEEKIMPATTSTTTTATTTPTNPTNQHHKQRDQETHKTADKYQRVYADWKPSSTLDNTDVVGNIQAIADAATKSQPHLTTAEELRQYRRQRSQEQSQTPGVLHSIAEEDRRKSIIQLLGESDGSADCLKIYVRRPSAMDMKPEPAKPKEAAPSENITSSAHEDPFASLLDHHKSHNESQYASKEIDADNIETPPVTRRVLATPNTTVVTVSMTDKPKHLPEEKNTTASTAVSTAESDAPGHFDRHASARRTRRYKRPTDYSSGNEELATSTNQEIKQSASANEVRRLQKDEQQREREREREEQPDKARNITKLEKVGRHISSINQEDVREAIRNLKSPTGTPERPWSPPRELTPSKLKLSASGHHELNDEGFEETQSLVSDTPSHGKGESTNSSCNETNDAPSQQRSRPLSKQKTTTTSIMGMGMGSRLSDRLQQARLRGSSTSAAPGSRHNPMPATQTASQSSAAASATAKRSLSASRPLRMPNGSPMLGATPNGSIRSASGVRRDPSYALNAPKSRDVERSSSRNSLRSSRSSINSAASTQTVVRRLPSVQRTATVSVDSSPSKRPLAAQNARPATARGVPASRSSSSGSSVGPSVILVRSKLTPGQTTRSAQAAGQPLGNSTSFKENQSTSTTAATASASASRLTAARSAMLVKNVLNQQAKTSSNSSSSNPQQRNPRQSVSSFMRPTASSATKRQK
ncbi:formin-J isoform X1 [Drosophila sulfurigaster albostrigata]|uniref:formin-J isoform X1 n=1 Tax=Drosophila sulfurigaster albostrigata TaxID=89887 RepID=UPI002D21BF33|nr:formin-J isoform X1 [Drosophila sulfurigaster albostrigata]XP_062128228.1 formin-J isoform X1 [Drosophila sulfurigaster albostrigata]